MKTGKTLDVLAAEIMRQKETKKDYVAPTSAMAMVVERKPEEKLPKVLLDLQDTGRFGIQDHAHGQMQSHVGIPSQYYQLMLKEAPDLLATNVNHWFQEKKAGRMVRVLDGHVRAVMSGSFRPLDNFDFASAILPVLADRYLDVISCDITETKLYIKAIDKREVQIPVGHKMGDGTHTIFDCCAPAFIASNSEVGAGRLTLETGIYTRGCTNLSWWSAGGMTRRHVGARHELTEGVQNIDEMLSEKTKQKTDEALWMQVRDVLKAAFNEAHIKQRAEKLTAAAETKIEGKVEQVVLNAAARFNLREDEQENVLKHLIEGGSLSQYGLHAAFTRAAQDVDGYDRATEMEYMGGKIIELPRADWASLNAA